MDYKKMLADANQREKIEAVAKGTLKKPGITRKFMDTFFAEDVVDVKEYILDNVIIPNIKRVLSQSFNTLLFGKGAGGRDRGEYRDYVSYRNYFDDDRPSRRSAPSSKGRRIYHWDDITFVDDEYGTGREKAEKVLDKMYEDLQQYGLTTVQWLYEYSGNTAPWTAHNYGWTSIKSADIVNIGGGEWAIKMPKPMPIE